MNRVLRWGALWLAVIGLASCATRSEGPDAGPIRAELAARLSEAEQAHSIALSLWDRLIEGEQVSCQEYIPAPLPVVLADDALTAYPQAVAIQDQINEGTSAIRAAAAWWDAECSDSRRYVPLSAAREGRAITVSAGEALAGARQSLAAWSGG